MAKNVDVNVNVNDNADESIARLRELRNEIRNVAVGSEDFRKLRQEMDDIEDSLKAGKTAAGNFADVLGTVPGPIGEIGSRAASTIDTLKGLGKLKMGDLVSSFTSLKDDVVSAAKGLANLTGITKIYTVVNNALAASFVKVGVGEAAAATGAKAFAAALTATGIGALVVGLGLAVSALMDFINAEDESAKAIRETNEALANQKSMYDEISTDRRRVAKVNLERMKAEGATEAELRKQMIEDAQDDIIEAADNQQRVEKESYKALAKLQNDFSEKAVEARKKYFKDMEDAQNAHQDAIANLQILRYQDQVASKKEADDAALKAEQKAEKDRTEAYNKEVEANRQKYQKMIDDAKIAGKDTTAIEIQKAESLLKIQKKYGKETFDVAQEIKLKKDQLSDKEKADMIAFQKEVNDALINSDIERRDAAIAAEKEKFQKLLDDARLNAQQRADLETALRENLALINKEYDKKEVDNQKEKDAKLLNDKMILNDLIINDERNGYEKRLQAVQEQEELIKQAVYESEAQRTADLKANADLRTEIEMQAYEAKMAINMAYMDLVSQTGQLLSDIGDLIATSAGKQTKASKNFAKAGVIVEKAAAIGQIIASTAVANAKSVAAMPLTAGQPWVTINTISAGLSIASVLAQSAKAIMEINKADSESGGSGGSGDSGGSGSAKVLPSKFGKGGLLYGRKHAEGGIMTPMGELEGGEFVVNRQATSSFLPMLQAINAMGGGSGQQNNMSSTAEYSGGGAAPIIKTYVVASEVTSAQEANKRIADMAKI